MMMIQGAEAVTEGDLVKTIQTTTLLIGVWNLNGLYSYAKGEQIEKWLWNNKIDILVVPEHKQKKGAERTNILRGWKGIYSSTGLIESVSMLAKWGVAIFFRDAIQLVPNSIEKGEENSILEGRAVSASITLKGEGKETKNLRITGVYAPSGSKNKRKREEFFQAFQEWKKKWENEEEIVLGDFNERRDERDVWREQPKIKPEPNLTLINKLIRKNKWHDTLRETQPQYNILQHATYEKKKYKSRIDYIFTNFNWGGQRTWVKRMHGERTDHNPLIMDLDLAESGLYHIQATAYKIPPRISVNPNSKEANAFRDKCKAWYDELPSFYKDLYAEEGWELDKENIERREEERKENFKEMYERIGELCVTTASQIFNAEDKEKQGRRKIGLKDEIRSALVQARRKLKAKREYEEGEKGIRENNQNKTNHLKHMLNPKQIPGKKYFENLDIQNATTEKREEWEKQTKHTRNILTRISDNIDKGEAREKLKEFYNHREKEAIKNSKASRRMWYGGERQGEPRAVLDEAGNVLLLPEDILERSAQYFEELGRRGESAPVEKPWMEAQETKRIREEVRKAAEDNKNLGKPISKEELEQQLKHIPKGGAPGLDKQQAAILKLLPPTIKNLMRGMANTLLIYEWCPNFLKVGEIVIIYKKGDDRDLNNYRGITLLNIQYKLVTGILATRLNNFMDKWNLGSKSQGAKKGMVCGQKVHLIQNLIADAKRKGKKIYLAATDLVKAFDRTQYEGFKDAMESIGLDNHFQKIHEAFQEGFKCRVRTRYGLSREIDIQRGIKQGCPASPGKFILFMDLYLRWIESSELGYNLQPTTTTTNHKNTNINIPAAAWVDDVTLIADKWENLNKMTQMLNHFVQAYGMEINTKEDKSTTMWEGNEPPIQITVKGKTSNIHKIKEGEAIRILGYWLTANLNTKSHWERIEVRMKEQRQKIGTKKGGRQGKANLVNFDLFGIMTFSADTFPAPKKMIQRWQTEAKRIIVHPESSEGFTSKILCLPREEIGIEVKDLQATCDGRLVQGMINALNSEDIQVSESTRRTWVEISERFTDSQNALEGRRRMKRQWTNFPPNYLQVKKIMQDLNLEVIEKDATIEWDQATIQSFINILGVEDIRGARKRAITLANKQGTSIAEWIPKTLEEATNKAGLGKKEEWRERIEEELKDKNLGKQTREILTDTLQEGIERLVEQKKNFRWASQQRKRKIGREEINLGNLGNKVGTDGSYKEAPKKKRNKKAREGKSGASVVGEEGGLHGSKIPGRQSIRRAEAFALLAATQALKQTQGKKHIYSDAKTEIDLIQRGRRKEISKAEWKKINNRSILRKILEEIEGEDIEIHHVEAHTDKEGMEYILNKEADIEAKIARETATNYWFEEQWPTADNFAVIQGNNLIEENIHKLVYRERSEEERKTTLKKKTAQGFQMEGYWKKVSSEPLTGDGNKKNRNFAWKLRTRTLPTFRFLQKRKPHLYEGRKCPLCEEHEETIEHILTQCTATTELRGEMERKIRKVLPSRRDGQEWKMWIPGTSDYDPSETNKNSIYGKIPKQTKKTLIASTGQNKKKAETIAKEILNIQIEQYNQMWKRRNEEIKKKELTYKDLEEKWLDDPQTETREREKEQRRRKTITDRRAKKDTDNGRKKPKGKRKNTNKQQPNLPRKGIG